MSFSTAVPPGGYVRRAICGICPAGCWVEVSIDSSGRLAEVHPDSNSHMGAICNLGRHSSEIVYSPDRLLHPMRRTGSKGTYDFQRISWEEAYQEIADKLISLKQQHGPESTAVYTGRGSFERSECDIFQPKGVPVSSASSVLFPFGSPNTLGVGALCYVSFAMIAPHVTMGGMLVNMYSDLENADLIVVWGANPATDCPPRDFSRIMTARNHGAEVVCIDPRRTATARSAQAQWIPVRPGTDGALALSLCQVIISEELFDEAFVRDWTLGFDDFANYVQHFRPEVAEGITGVPAGDIYALAMRIATAQGASSVMYSGLEYSDSGVQAIRATNILWALAGQLDVPGGRCFTMPGSRFPMNRSGHISNPDVKRALGLDRFPLYSSYRGESHAIALPESVLEGKPYPIRCLIINGASIITSWPQPEIWRATLSSLEFLVCVDRFMTADAAYADLVLPASTHYEHQSYMTYGPIFRVRDRVIDPVGESRPSYFIMAEIARRLGYGHLYPQTEEEVLEHALSGSGFSPDDVRQADGTVELPSVMMEYKKWEKGLLRPDGQPGFDTPSRKLEIASSILEEYGYDALPVYTEPAEGPLAQPELAQRFPLVFNSGSRVTTDFRSQFHSIPGLLKDRPEPTILMNPVDAGGRGIQEGDMVEVVSPRGRATFHVRVSDTIVAGAIDADMGGGGPVGPDAWKRCNVNELTNLRHYDRISGFPVYKALLCDVRKVGESTGAGHHVNRSRAEGAVENTSCPAAAPDPIRVYLDYNATAPLHEEVLTVMEEHLREHFGNPSSIHRLGNTARFAIDSARRQVGQLLNCTARRVIFTAGGSEADNLAIKGVVFASRGSGARTHVITSCVEHPAVLECCRWLEEQGFPVTYLPVTTDGRVDPRTLREALSPRTLLVSIMMANNETGAIQPIQTLAEVAHSAGALFHTDAVQAVGKIPVDVEELGVDLLSLSGHKLQGPKGIGALYVRKGVHIEPLVHGGKQEHHLRAGTENVAAIAGLGQAAALSIRRVPENERLRRLCDRLEAGLRALAPGAVLNGPKEDRLPNTLNISLPNIRGEAMVLALDQRGVALSSGSACRAGSPRPSHALLAMGMQEERAHGALRFSLGWDTSEADIAHTLSSIEAVMEDSSAGIRFVPCR